MSNKNRSETFVDRLAKIVASVLRPFVKMYRKVKGFQFKKPNITMPKFKMEKPEISFFDKVKNVNAFDKFKDLFKKEKNEEFFNGTKEFLIKYKIAVASVILGLVVCGGGTYYILNTPVSSVADIAIPEENLANVALDSKIPELFSKYDEMYNMGSKKYVLRINDEAVANFNDKADGEKVLEIVKKQFAGNEEVNYKKVYFKENVSLDEENVKAIDSNNTVNAEDIASYIIKGTDEKKIHKIEKGENFWLLAKKYNIKVDDLVKANPGIKPETIQIGQEVSLIVPKPLISVITIEEKEMVETLPRQVEYIDTDDYYKGEYKVKTSGKDGERKIVAEIYKENGIEKNKVVLSEEILVASEVKVMYRGTKNPPPRIGSGVFARPLSRGTVTSPFGMRWGRLHAGIDIGVPIGTPVKAADGGKVIFAGNKSGYGLVVIINHGGNLESRYAHNSKLLVKKGDRVYKGQKIALSGNTGRSTGPHLHFEIRKNGTPINPTKYVKF